MLTKLNISIDNLPQKCLELLHHLSTVRVSSQMDELDPVTISLQQSREMADQLDDEYEILLLRQKNEELQSKIDRNNNFLELLRKDLETSRRSLTKKEPNPDNIQECYRQMKRKVASYEESCDKAKVKFSKLCVPAEIMPKCLLELVTTLEQMSKEATALRQRADDIALAREARDTLLSLRK